MEKAHKRINRFLMSMLAAAMCFAALPARALSLISDEETEVFLHQTLKPIFQASGTTFNPRNI